MPVQPSNGESTVRNLHADVFCDAGEDLRFLAHSLSLRAQGGGSMRLPSAPSVATAGASGRLILDHAVSLSAAFWLWLWRFSAGQQSLAQYLRTAALRTEVRAGFLPAADWTVPAVEARYSRKESRQRAEDA